MDKVLNYINQRLQDINITLNDDLVSEEDKAYVMGQKDELEVIANMICDLNS